MALGRRLSQSTSKANNLRVDGAATIDLQDAVLKLDKYPDTPGTGIADFLSTPTSANLQAAITDETGTGSLVFSSAPTFARIINQTSGLSWASGAVSTIQSAGSIGTHTLSSSAVAAFHTFNLNSDNVDATAAQGVYNVYCGMVVGGANVKGHRTALAGVAVVSSPTGNTGNLFYTGGESRAIASANDNGTAITPLGTIVGGFDSASLLTGATYWSGLIGREIDVECRTGTAPKWKTGLQIVQRSTDVESGWDADEAFLIANQSGGTAPGWDVGVAFGTPHGIWAIKSTGTMIGTQATALGGPAYEAEYGVDFSAVTFGTAAFKSNGFEVDGSGVVTGVLTNCTGLPASTGISGLGSGMTTLLASSYVTSTYTPVVSFGGASTGITYSTQEGRYTRIGDLVFVTGYIVLTSKGTATGAMRISAPIAAAAMTQPGAGSISYAANMSGLTSPITLGMNTGASTFVPRDFGAAGTAEIDDTNCTNTTAFTFAITYKV
ncbi:MAG: hypothetical protein RIR33_3712 [Pseudomonadota bacterium]|jgi:hypothetical protein